MIRIALMGDLHYPQLDPDNTELTEAVHYFYQNYLNEFINLEADLHVSIGDLTHLGLENEFLSVYEHIWKRGKNFRTVLGNHDVLSLPKEKISQLIKQPRFDAIETEDCLLIFLDTTKEFELHGWGLDQEQWDWLETQVNRAKDKPLFIFAHHPIPNTTMYSPENETFEAMQDIRPLLEKRNGLILYFNGHTHAHSIIQKEDSYFIQAGAAVCDPSFLLIELDQNKVEIQKVDVSDAKLDTYRSVLYEQMPDFHSPPSVTDRDSSITYKIVRNTR